MLTTWVGVVTDFVVNCNSSDLSIEMVPLIACDKILFPSEGKGHDDDGMLVLIRCLFGNLNVSVWGKFI